MIFAILRMTVRPARLEEIVQAFWSIIGPTRVEPGCLTCGLFQEVGNPEAFHYQEEWLTAEDLERHMRSARYERLLAIMEAAAEPPRIQYCSVEKTRGLEYVETIRLGHLAQPNSK
jgi:quinol monooxygenase YgiN